MNSSLPTLPTLTYDQIKFHSSQSNKPVSIQSPSSTPSTFVTQSNAINNSFQNPNPNPNLNNTNIKPDSSFNHLQSSQTHVEVAKRLRDQSPTITQPKKSKAQFGPITKLATELFDSSTQSILGFRCFRECEVVGSQLESHSLIESELDDDVSSESEQICCGIEYLIGELEYVLITHCD